ncbi:monovalent cation/H(+) antiporter subunit G [Desulfoferrobacter suflitae]|uniref:monovalent cation/H(+) antiporter subunit G n=1 Tax=Desulfoferrobacter suflitae TaxID=2865782 RepID=UPI002164A6BF|nr:monovalent cation/H(+) antiporter subunit G [Desulfoferrobacter suflitae]MCK8600362.1 monovalent cation/H(+) antiporter subunit G [Desulfoferrobacter suflitae]
MRLIMGTAMVAVGVLFWLWGTAKLPGNKSYLWKLHALGISDTLGSLFIVVGLLLRSPAQWHNLLLPLGSILFWGVMLAFILAKSVARRSDS